MDTAKEAVRVYLKYCKEQKGLSEKTLKAYSIDLNQCLKKLKESTDRWNDHRENVQNDLMRLCRKEFLNQYAADLYGMYKPRSARRKIAVLKAFFRFMEYEEWIETNPFNKIRVQHRVPKVLPKTIPSRLVEQLLRVGHTAMEDSESTRLQQKLALRDTAILELLFASGMRIAELCTLTKENVDLSDGVIRISGKGSRERMIQICNLGVLKVLKAYRKEFADKINQTGYFFINQRGNRFTEQSARCVVRKYSELAGISMHITPHMFRHTFATLLLEEGVDIRYIQQMLGHSSITTTEIYTQVTSSKQKAILETKHPRNRMKV